MLFHKLTETLNSWLREKCKEKFLWTKKLRVIEYQDNNHNKKNAYLRFATTSGSKEMKIIWEKNMISVTLKEMQKHFEFCVCKWQKF